MSQRKSSGRGAAKGYVRARRLEVYEPGATEPNAKVYVQASQSPSEHDEGSAEEGVCQICGIDYPVWVAPSPLWNKVMRIEEGHERYAFVCPNCFAKEAEKMGIVPTAWILSEEELPSETLNQHVHQYTIPVEWAYIHAGFIDDPTKRPVDQTPDLKKVTKLRCACGEEIER